MKKLMLLLTLLSGSVFAQFYEQCYDNGTVCSDWEAHPKVSTEYIAPEALSYALVIMGCGIDDHQCIDTEVRSYLYNHGIKSENIEVILGEVFDIKKDWEKSNKKVVMPKKVVTEKSSIDQKNSY